MAGRSAWATGPRAEPWRSSPWRGPDAKRSRLPRAAVEAGRKGDRPMTEPAIAPPSVDSRVEQMFPTLTPQQIARIEPHGRLRAVHHDEVLVQAGDENVPF